MAYHQTTLPDAFRAQLVPAQQSGLTPAERYRNFVHPNQQSYLTFILDWDYVGLVEEIEKNDRENGPNYHSSRINSSRAPGWTNKGVTILLRTDQDLLIAVTNNELPHRARTRERGQSVAVRTQGARPAKANDPVIYINCLADGDGNGLSRVEFERLLQFLLGVEAHPEGEDGQAIDKIWNGWVTGGTRSGLMEGLQGREHNKIKFFCAFHREHTLAPHTGNGPAPDRFMIPAEVGWAMIFENRKKDHNSLSGGSPWFFRLVSCALKHLFPGRFEMHQFVLFDIVSPDEAHIGESIASHLASSYASYGGFNHDQAGLTNTGMFKTGVSETWSKIANYAMSDGAYFLKAGANIANFQAAVQRRSDAAEVRNDHDRATPVH